MTIERFEIRIPSSSVKIGLTTEVSVSRVGVPEVFTVLRFHDITSVGYICDALNLVIDQYGLAANDNEPAK